MRVAIALVRCLVGSRFKSVEGKEMDNGIFVGSVKDAETLVLKLKTKKNLSRLVNMSQTYL